MFRKLGEIGGINLNSPIKWMGGKYRLRKAIVRMIPKHICYCEPFGGAGWVLFEKNPSEVEVYNDINKELVNFFKIIRNNPVEFIERTNDLLISRDLFQGFRETNPLMMSEVDRAVRFYYLLHFSFGAKMKHFIITPLKKPPRVLERVKEEANLVRNRLINTVIENRDYGEIIKSYDRSSTFFYCDPPYYELTDYRSQGSGPFGNQDHIRLRDCLSGIQGKFLLSINDHPETRKLYAGFNIEEVKVRYSICKSDKGSVYKELLISNYETPTESGMDNAA